MRAFAAAVAAFVAAFVAATALAGSPAVELRIVVWPSGPDGPAKRWTLRCEPTGGTLPTAARACRTLASLDDPFAPTPPDTACTQIYGGPQVARVTGTFHGRRIWTRFTRGDGCAIARWNRLRALFPVRV